ncbi:MAG: hypothetical protein IE933_01525 [Sphingomonadales bacterium]|nr:hypothetical protein [Sphingomonadales bacterium]
MSMPPREEEMASASACAAYLRDRAAEDAQMAKPETLAEDGSRQTVSIEPISAGVEDLGRGRARYAARIWYVNGWPRPDLGQIEYRATWEAHTYECRGRRLIAQQSSGFTSESYEPMPAASDAKQ